jgi:phenylacetate-CoA ligase
MLKNYYLLKLKRDQWKSLKYLKDEQLRRLRAIVKYAYDYVPYYHRLFASAKIKPEDIRTFDDLLKIPLTDKQMIQKNYDDMFPLGVDVSKFASSFTSGSTGIPLKIVFDNSARSYMAALTQYIFSECGVRPHDKFVTIWGRAQSIVWSRPYVRFLRGINEILVPAFFEETKLVNVLRCINPDVLCTFPSILSLLANSDVSEIRPRLIFTQGETVTQDYRDTVKKAFNRELLDTYGSVEFEFLAFECNTHRGLHMITDGAYIEFIDENGECVAPREEGEIIVTGLYNRVMPLIRYRIGDAGIPTNEKCPCGRSWPLIKSILGRMNDYLILPSGRKISFWNLYYPHLYNELKKNEFFLTQYQIIQDRKDRIIFKLIKGREFDLKIAENIKTNLEAYFAAHQEDMKVIMQFVDEIPQERTGKRRWLICMLQ